MNPHQTACQDVTMTAASSPTPLFNSTDFTPLNCLKRSRPAPPPLIQRTVFQPGDDWQSYSATTVLDALHASVCGQSEAHNGPTSPLSLRRASAAVEVDSSAADLFTPLTQPFPRQLRLIQCTSCRRPLLITRLFQHLPHCPARGGAGSPQPLSSYDDPLLDLVAAPYISPPSSPAVRKKPRIFPPAKKITASLPKKSNSLDTPPSLNDHRFSLPREEDNWRVALTPLAPAFKPISKYRRRRVYLPPPQDLSSQRKRTPAVEKKAVEAAASASIHIIPARSPTHRHMANARDPLRNAVSKCAPAFPWVKLLQIALPLYASRNLNRRKASKEPPPANSSSTVQGCPSSPPSTPRFSSNGNDSTEMQALATAQTTPSLAGALLYLRGQGLRHLANTPLASLDPPQQPLVRNGPFYHGQAHVAPMGTYQTDRPSANNSEFKLPAVAPITVPPMPQSTTSHPPRFVPADPRTKKLPTVPNPSNIPNSVGNGGQSFPISANGDVAALPNSSWPAGSSLNGTVNTGALTNGTPTIPTHTNVLPPASVNSNTTVAVHPGSNAMKGGNPITSNADGALSAHSAYVNSPSLPPPSPSVNKRRASKARAQTTSSIPLSSGLAIAGKPTLPASRKSSGSLASTATNATHSKVTPSAMLNSQQRTQSPASSMVQTPPTEPMGRVSLAPSAAGSPSFNSHIMSQQNKSYRSPGRAVGPSSVPTHAINGQELAGVSGVTNPVHLMAGNTGRPGKGRQQANPGMGIISPGMGPVPLANAAVKTQSPSQGSLRSGEYSSLQIPGSASNNAYDPMILSTALSTGGIGGKRVPHPRAENSKQPLDFHQQVMAQMAAHAVKAPSRDDVVPDVRRVVPNIGGKTPSFGSDGGMRLQGPRMHNLSPVAHMAENTLHSGVGARASKGQKSMANGNQRPSIEREGMKDKATDIETQLRHAETLRVDGSGIKDKVSNMGAGAMSNTIGFSKTPERSILGLGGMSQGYYNGALSTPGDQTVIAPHSGRKGQPDLALLGLAPNVQSSSVMNTGSVGTAANNVSAAAAAAAAANLMQGMPDVRSMHGMPIMGGSNGLQQPTQHETNVLNLLQENGMSAGLSNNHPLSGLMGNVTNNGLMDNGSNNNKNVGPRGGNMRGTTQNPGLPTDAMLQQILSGRGGMSSNMGGSNSSGLGSVSLENGLHATGALSAPLPGRGFHGGNFNAAALSLNGTHALSLNRPGAGLQTPHGLLPLGTPGLGDEPQRELTINFQESDLLDRPANLALQDFDI